MPKVCSNKLEQFFDTVFLECFDCGSVDTSDSTGEKLKADFDASSDAPITPFGAALRCACPKGHRMLVRQCNALPCHCFCFVCVYMICLHYML